MSHPQRSTGRSGGAGSLVASAIAAAALAKPASTLAGFALTRAVVGPAHHGEVVVVPARELDGSAPSVDRPGEGADTPLDLPARGWKQVAGRVAKEVKADNVSLLAGGTAFFALLAFVPAIAALVAIYGIVTEPSQVADQLANITAALPADVSRAITDQAEQVAARSNGGLGLAAATAILLSLWSASSGMSSLMGALSLAYDRPDERGFVRLRGTAILLTLGAVVVLAADFFLVTQVGSLADRFGLGSVGETVVAVLRWPLLAAVVVGSLAVLYQVGPDRRQVAWRWITPGSVVATFGALVASVGLSVYVSVVDVAGGAGPIGAVIVLMLWLFVTAFAVIVGAELNAEIENQADPSPRR